MLHEVDLLVRHELKLGNELQCTLEKYNRRFSELPKTLLFYWRIEFEPTEGSLRVSVISSAMRSRLSDYFNDVARITPSFVINAVTYEPTIMYLHLLLALRDRELGTINGSFAGTLYCAMKGLESSWKELVHDIESGTINDKAEISLDQSIRCRLESLISPDPAMAQELRVEFEKGFHGIMSRVWAHCAGVRCLDTGSMKIYADILQREH